MYEEVQTGRLYEKIVEQIQRSIIEGELQPGDQLPSERELGKQFGVSRTSIREAIRVLTLMGLVEVSHGRGTFITDQSPSAIRSTMDSMIHIARKEGSGNLIELREILEPEIAALAAVRASEEHLLAIREAVNTMETAMNDPKRYDEYIEADLDFHLNLAEGAGNPLFLVLIDLLVVQLRQQRVRAASKEGGLYRGQTHHRRILAAVESRDPEAARRVMYDHIQQIRGDIK